MSQGVLGVLLLLALLLIWRGRRRGAMAVLLLAVAGVWAVGCWPLPQWMLDGLQNRYADQAGDTWAARNAIVVLGAGTTRDAANKAETPIYAFGRIAHALALYQQCHASGNDCKLLVSGGDPMRNGRSVCRKSRAAAGSKSGSAALIRRKKRSLVARSKPGTAKTG